MQDFLDLMANIKASGYLANSAILEGIRQQVVAGNLEQFNKFKGQLDSLNAMEAELAECTAKATSSKSEAQDILNKIAEQLLTIYGKARQSFGQSATEADYRAYFAFDQNAITKAEEIQSRSNVANDADLFDDNFINLIKEDMEVLRNGSTTEGLSNEIIDQLQNYNTAFDAAISQYQAEISRYRGVKATYDKALTELGLSRPAKNTPNARSLANDMDILNEMIDQQIERLIIEDRLGKRTEEEFQEDIDIINSNYIAAVTSKDPNYSKMSADDQSTLNAQILEHLKTQSNYILDQLKKAKDKELAKPVVDKARFAEIVQKHINILQLHGLLQNLSTEALTAHADVIIAEYITQEIVAKDPGYMSSPSESLKAEIIEREKARLTLERDLVIERLIPKPINTIRFNQMISDQLEDLKNGEIAILGDAELAEYAEALLADYIAEEIVPRIITNYATLTPAERKSTAATIVAYEKGRLEDKKTQILDQFKAARDEALAKFNSESAGLTENDETFNNFVTQQIEELKANGFITGSINDDSLRNLAGNIISDYTIKFIVEAKIPGYSGLSFTERMVKRTQLFDQDKSVTARATQLKGLKEDVFTKLKAARTKPGNPWERKPAEPPVKKTGTRTDTPPATSGPQRPRKGYVSNVEPGVKYREVWAKGDLDKRVINGIAIAGIVLPNTVLAAALVAPLSVIGPLSLIAVAGGWAIAHLIRTSTNFNVKAAIKAKNLNVEAAQTGDERLRIKSGRIIDMLYNRARRKIEMAYKWKKDSKIGFLDQEKSLTEAADVLNAIEEGLGLEVQNYYDAHPIASRRRSVLEDEEFSPFAEAEPPVRRGP